MSLMRYTIVDQNGGVSFVADEYMLTALVAACSTNPTTVEGLLDAVHEVDRRPRDQVRHALSVFDEHNVPGSYDAIHRTLAETPSIYASAFRIVDERTRQASLEPVKAGLIIFNLKERRIIQVQNSVGIERNGTAHHHNGRQWTARVHPYELPDSWRIVP